MRPQSQQQKRFPLSVDPEPMQKQQEEQIISGKCGLLDPIRGPVYVMLIQPENIDGRPLEADEKERRHAVLKQVLGISSSGSIVRVVCRQRRLRAVACGWRGGFGLAIFGCFWVEVCEGATKEVSDQDEV